MNLKQLRKSRGLTQQEVANYIGISQNNYSYWENGKVKIDNKSLKKLSNLFNVSIDYLLGTNNDTFAQNKIVPIEQAKNIWLGSLNELDVTLITTILKLSELQKHKVQAYIYGMLD